MADLCSASTIPAGFITGNPVNFTCDAADNCSTNGPSRVVMTAPPLGDTIPPTWPGGSLTASNVATTSLTLVWSTAMDDDVGVTLYIVYRDGSPIATLGITNTHSATGLTADTQYTFKVEACDAAGNCSTNGPSTVVRTPIAPAGVDVDAPDWPGGSLTASDISSTSLGLR